MVRLISVQLALTRLGGAPMGGASTAGPMSRLRGCLLFVLRRGGFGAFGLALRRDTVPEVSRLLEDFCSVAGRCG